MLVKDFVNAQVPPRKAPVCLFAFQRWLFPGFCGLGSFPIALYLSRRNGALVCVQTFPKGSGGGGVCGKGRARCSMRCSDLNGPGWGASQLHLRRRMNPRRTSQRLRVMRTLRPGCQRRLCGAWDGSSRAGWGSRWELCQSHLSGVLQAAALHGNPAESSRYPSFSIWKVGNMYCWPPRRLDELIQVKPQYSVPGLVGAQTIRGHPQLLLLS